MKKQLLTIPFLLMKRHYPASSDCTWYAEYNVASIRWYNDYDNVIHFHSEDLISDFQVKHLVLFLFIKYGNKPIARLLI